MYVFLCIFICIIINSSIQYAARQIVSSWGKFPATFTDQAFNDINMLKTVYWKLQTSTVILKLMCVV